VSFLVGNIRYSRGSGGSGTEAFRIVPMDDPQFTASNPRPALSPAPGGNLKVASFNLLNYFANVDTGAAICGPQSDSNCRGADSAEELARQTEKTVRALQLLDVDIVGLVELENQGNAGLQLLVDALNARGGARAWSFIDTGNVGDDAIRNAFIYDSARVSPVGSFAIIDSTVDVRFNSNRNRPSIAQTFLNSEGGGVVTVVVSHLKSKGSSCDDAGDPDTGDGQANCNDTRTLATAALANWLASDPTGSGDSDVLIIGDLNAYLEEDPVTGLEMAGYSNLLRIFRGSQAYSFVFRGESGALDHALVSASLLPQVTDALEWHINADEPPVLDYNLGFGRNPALFDPTTPYRASDHDPVVIGLQLR
jgi:predicted extracellular nuclease